MSGLFEVLVASDDEQKIAAQEVQDKLAAAVYDVRQEFGDFLFKAADISEFRTRVHLVKPDMMKVVDRHVPPVSGVMGRIATRRGSILEKEFKARLGYGPDGHVGYEEEGPLHPDQQAHDDASAYPRGHSKGEPNWGDVQDYGERPESKHLGWYATGTGDGPALHTDETYHEESGALIPEGNWPGFQDSVDQTSNKVDDHVFAPGEHDKTYTVDTGADFVSGGHESRRQAVSDEAGVEGNNNGIYNVMQGQGFGPEFENKTGSAYTDRMLGPGMDPDEARAVAPAVSKQPGIGAPGKGTLHQQPSGLELDPNRVKDNMVTASVEKLLMRYVGFCRRNRLPLNLSTLERHGRRLSPHDYLVIATNLNKIAAPDYLQKANDALTGLLNQKAEDFQSGISPLQQALQVVQQSQAIDQANNPLSVAPPAGTVNVLPDQPQGLPGQDPAAAAGGGMVDQSAPPPAAAGPVGPDPQQMAARRRHAVDLKEIRIEDKNGGLFSGQHPAGHRVVFRASPEDARSLHDVMHGDLAQNFSGVSVGDEDIVHDHHAQRQGGHPKGQRPVKVRG